MDSFLVLASYILPWKKRSKIKISTSRFIMSEKRLISSILIRLVLHRRIGWRGLLGVERGRLPQNSRTSFPQPQENDVGSKILQFIHMMKIKKMLGHNTLRCTNTATSSKEMN